MRPSAILSLSLLPLLVVPAASGTARAGDLPASFEADLVYLVVEAADGRTLRLYTDTGGGLFLKQEAVERLGLDTEAAGPDLAREMGADARTTRLPDFVIAAGVPEPSRMEGRMPVMPAGRPSPLPGMSPNDGLLGQAWFANRTWTWDYGGQHLRLEPPEWRPATDMRSVPLGFKTDAQGVRLTSFPRIDVVIDGDTVPLLLDTGATTVLAPHALEAMGDDLPAQRATSMISDSLFRAWRTAHPDWKVIEAAQAGTGSAMIEVPEVEIAGWRVGPVWFTHREDTNFHDFMSGLMDARVEGALGGNAFRHFVMTVDYPDAVAYFRCPGCNAPAEADPPATPPPGP